MGSLATTRRQTISSLVRALRGDARCAPFAPFPPSSLFPRSSHAGVESGERVAGGEGGGPLAGFTVLDLGQVVAGNFCGMLLGYFGANVIKVEPPLKGDPLRHLRDLDSTGTSLWWRTYGRNRQCITVDLRKEAGRDLIRRLAHSGTVDVILENFRPGVMEGWGLGPNDLPEHVIMSRISGYGQTGPKAKLPGYASVCEANSGFRSLNGYPDRPPVRPNISLGDSLAGMHAAFGVVMSLLERQKSGRGQVVDAAITESVFNLLEGVLPEYVASGKTKKRSMSGSSISEVVPSGVWLSKDNHYVVIGGNGNSVYDRLITAIGRPDMTTDSSARYASDSARVAAEDEICAVIDAYVSSHNADEVISTMEAARVPAGLIMTIEDIFFDPHWQSRGMWEEIEGITVPTMSPKLSRTPGRTTWLGRSLGADTDEFLKTKLGLDAAAISKLREEGVV